MSFEYEEPLEDRLERLRAEHRTLDARIAEMADSLPMNEFLVKRLKLQKLRLKDQITVLESQLIPDIIA